MQLITHRSHLDDLSESPLKTHITARFDQLSQDTDVPPNIILVENGDEITGPDYAFVGTRGLLSDLFEEHEPGQPELVLPYEWASHISELLLFEALLLVSNEGGYWILIPESISKIMLVPNNSDSCWSFRSLVNQAKFKL